MEVTLVTPGQRSLLTFAGTAGQRISGRLELVSGSMGGCGGALEIQRPDGTQLSTSPSCGGGPFIDAVVLPLTGTYTAVVNPGLASLPTASVRLWDVPADVTGTMTFGTPFGLTFTRPGQNGALIFGGTNGQRVVMAASNESISGHLTTGCDISTLIRKPDGGQLSLSNTCMETGLGGFMDVKTLPATGTYTVEVDPSTAATGRLTLTLYDVPSDLTGSLTIGASPTSLSLSIGQGASYTFAGTSGQQVTVRLTGNTIGSTLVRLLKPDLSQLTSRTSSASSFNLTTQTLPTSGTYTVTVDPSTTNAGNISVQVTSP